MRRSGACGVMLGLVVMTAATGTADEAFSDTTAPGAPSLALEISIATAQELAEATRRVVTTEAEAIWREAGVRLRWRPEPPGAPAPAMPLRVLVIPRPETGPDQRWAVGELLPLTGDRALALASITGARRVLAEARVSQWSESPLSDDVRLGVVLGRAVAHEIGHFLLDTPTHARRGLMRAGFDPREFADPRAGATFALDPEASQWLRGHQSALAPARRQASGSTLWPPFSRFSSGRFSYPPHR